mmetsp:Transcript_122298/g.351341  ORF Transcript_122298/g.351341 Transcript_122298/m.351341 type:complete len:248 (+) Transcript_122298:842-1585(+)
MSAAGAAQGFSSTVIDFWIPLWSRSCGYGRRTWPIRRGLCTTAALRARPPAAALVLWISIAQAPRRRGCRRACRRQVWIPAACGGIGCRSSPRNCSTPRMALSSVWCWTASSMLDYAQAEICGICRPPAAFLVSLCAMDCPSACSSLGRWRTCWHTPHCLPPWILWLRQPRAASPPMPGRPCHGGHALSTSCNESASRGSGYNGRARMSTSIGTASSANCVGRASSEPPGCAMESPSVRSRPLCSTS